MDSTWDRDQSQRAEILRLPPPQFFDEIGVDRSQFQKEMYHLIVLLEGKNVIDSLDAGLRVVANSNDAQLRPLKLLYLIHFAYNNCIIH